MLQDFLVIRYLTVWKFFPAYKSNPVQANVHTTPQTMKQVLLNNGACWGVDNWLTTLQEFVEEEKDQSIRNKYCEILAG